MYEQDTIAAIATPPGEGGVAIVRISGIGAENIAAEAQRVLEEQVRNIIFPWMEREQTRNLSTAVFISQGQPLSDVLDL